MENKYKTLRIDKNGNFVASDHYVIDGFQHVESIPSNVWYIDVGHDLSLGFFVQVFDSDGVLMEPIVEMVDKRAIEVYFDYPVSGVANILFHVRA